MVTTPGITPVTIPLEEPTVAVAGELLLQRPPPAKIVTFPDAPTHKAVLPETAGGAVLTVTTATTPQPAVVV